jgi:hydroxymethylpyrimidine pyrophosphatase-like HAD family hydrolase
VAISLVVSDIDGTLLDNQGKLTAETHGIQTRQFPGGEVLDEQHLDAGKAGQAALVMARHHLQPILQYGDRHSERLVVGLLPDGHLRPNYAAHYLSNFAHQVQEVPLEDVAHSQVNPLRLVAFGLYDRLLAASAEIAVLDCGWQILPFGSYGAAELTVFAARTSKGTATVALYQKLGIPREEVLAIGDGPNDVSLLSAAGLGVAMANGSQEVKAIAQALAPSNQENGVAVAIQRYVFSDLPDLSP